MTKTYIQIDLDNIETSEAHANGSFTSGILRKVEGEWYSGENLVDLTGDISVTWLDEVAYQAEQDAIAALQTFKSNRQSLLDNAVVTANNFEFDADEISIGRMSNAILSAIAELDTFAMQWSLANTATGVMTDVTLGDLKLAHQLAVQNMANIWGV